MKQCMFNMIERTNEGNYSLQLHLINSMFYPCCLIKINERITNKDVMCNNEIQTSIIQADAILNLKTTYTTAIKVLFKNLK